jgi:hypothetical protein
MKNARRRRRGAALAVFAAKTIECDSFEVITASPYRVNTLFRGYGGR